jgi:hypothetical protein
LKHDDRPRDEADDESRIISGNETHNSLST